MDKCLLINLFGRPGVGKSTLALELVSNLKKMGQSAEYVPEYAKELIYKCHDQHNLSNHMLANQLYILAKQHKRIYDVTKSVDIAVCDSPLLFNLIYLREDDLLADPDSHFTDLVYYLHNTFNKKDFLLKSNHTYQKKGRQQTYDESMQIQNRIEELNNDFIEISTINEVWDHLND